MITQKFKDSELTYTGFEEENFKDLRKDFLTWCKDIFLLDASIIASTHCKIHSVDVKS